ncbi:MAG TPA: beta-ketoacyl synthase N-terminal-like domain-containing protein [Xanthobacteraceae bacterium]|nr:beta-ketoacyl synthase N-terminal-like domain-containing protein [Xanthobacteraceae bacterium]
MNTPTPNSPKAEDPGLVKRALAQIQDLRAKLAESEAARTAPIAIVGIGLRLPGGARDAASYEELLFSGTDAIRQVPADRWSLDDLYDPDPAAPGKMTTRFGGFIDDIDQFDADFFGISPREAESMDPQQRLMLEVSWEALENAGYAPSSLAGTATGIYLGIANGDYGRALLGKGEALDIYASTGNAYSVAAGRLSYQLGLHGPSVALDTACSSSLVAMHLASQALRSGDCDIALAGGINLIITPEMNIVFSKASMMAADGRCKTFDASADGYVRGEGCGMLVLRRLADAVASKDRILGVIRGSAVNQDGRSSGLTAPNGPAQEAVIRAALKAAAVKGEAISYVEAHGTGTPLGDPIEIGALSETLANGRAADAPLYVGSVKSNIGHLEAAAGVAGVIKVLLCLKRGEIPPSLHFNTGNPHIDWSVPIAVPTRTMAWPEIGGRRLAGVSSFGFSGCNAHLIIEGPPAIAATAPVAERPAHLLALSARDPATLQELARSYRNVLAGEGSVADICYTANAGRSHFPYRLAAVGTGAAELRRGLAAFLDGQPDEGVVIGRAKAGGPQVAFLFSGQGGEFAGMGRTLYDTSPTYRAAFDACAVAFAPYLDRPLLDLVTHGADGEGFASTAQAQPATFTVQYALAALWRSWGIEPVAVMGHSFGEYAAACVAGLMTLDNAARMVAERGRLTDLHALPGSMGVVFAPEAVVDGEIARAGGRVSIAAYNGPENFVLSGEPAAMAETLGRLEAGGYRVKALRVSYGSHSDRVEPVLAPFRAVLETVEFQPNRIPLVSNLTAGFAEADQVGRAEYWVTHLRQPVRFRESIRALIGQGATHFVEISPHPIVLGIAAENAQGEERAFLPSLKRDRADWSDLLESLQRLYVDGAAVDWAAFDRDYPRRRVALPTYPFRRRRHWAELAPSAPAARPAAERWQNYAAGLEREAARGPLDLNASSYPAKWAALGRLTTAHAARTLREAGLFAITGAPLSLDEVLTAAGIKPAYRHLVRRWLDRLVEAGQLTAKGERYVAAAPLPAPDMAAAWAEVEALMADNRPLLAYVRHCSGLVGKVLRGEESPIETLFPGGSYDIAEGLYEHSTTMRYINGLAAAAMAGLVEGRTPAKPLRVMEIGAGTGGTSSALLPVLPAGLARYHFTDVSSAFLERARERFALHPGASFGVFDLDQDLAAQNYAPGQFDVVVSANAVHASKDLRKALRSLHELLAPDGTLILVESTVHLDWFDMTTGLIEGWQHFADDLRTDDPLLPAATWVEALRVAGFQEARAFPGTDTPAQQLGQHVLVARRSSAALEGTGTEVPVAAPTILTFVDRTAVDADALRKTLADTLAGERLGVLRDFAREQVMRVLRRERDNPPDRNERLIDLGLDSLMAVQLRGALGKGLGIDGTLPASLVFDHPTIEALARHLLGRIDVAEPEPEPASVKAETPAALEAGEVAVLSDDQIEAILMERLKNG